MRIFYYAFWDSYRFFKALLTNKKLKASKEETQRRLEICYGCEKINKESRLFGKHQPRCSRCGCYLGLKTKLEPEHCPDDPQKW